MYHLCGTCAVRCAHSTLPSSSAMARGCVDHVRRLRCACSVLQPGERLLRCARCQQMWYCTKQHQKQHWKKHKARCTPPATPIALQTKAVTTTLAKPAVPQPPGSSTEFFVRGMLHRCTTAPCTRYACSPTWLITWPAAPVAALPPYHLATFTCSARGSLLYSFRFRAFDGLVSAHVYWLLMLVATGCYSYWPEAREGEMLRP